MRRARRLPTCSTNSAAQARLADAGAAETVTRRHASRRARRRRALAQERELALAADERRVQTASERLPRRRIAASTRQASTEPLLPLAARGSHGLELVAFSTMRRVVAPSRISPARGRLFEPLRRVDGIPGDERRRGPSPVTTSPLLIPTRIRSSAAPSPSSSFSRSTPARISTAARTARSASSSWTLRHAEDGHHRVADELLDGAAVALDRPRIALVPARDQAAQRLGIEALPSTVESARSQKTTVTVFRTSLTLARAAAQGSPAGVALRRVPGR